MELLPWLLEHYGQEQMRPGLERIREALGEYFPYFKKTKIVIIAGTNGKGETTLRLSELLKEHRQFVWTSPHIVRITERFRSERGEISLEELTELIKFCHEKVQRQGWELSFYEFLFFVFCEWAHKNPPEYLLLEVGLGGRLDAVNVFDADLVLLPSISRDHQEILGRRYDQILAEKLGTLRGKTTLIHFLELKYLVERAEKHADSLGAKVVSLKDKVTLHEAEFSLRNYVLAGAGYCYLEKKDFIPEEWIRPVMFLENRGERIKKDHEWLFFGSHNVDGLRKLIQFLTSDTYNLKRPPFSHVIVAFSRRSQSDLKVMIKILKGAFGTKVAVSVFNHPKALSLEETALLCREERVQFVQDIKAYVQGQDKNQRILVTGSYYFLGYIKSLLGIEQSSAHSRG